MEHSLGTVVGLLAGLLVSVGLTALLFKTKVLDMHFDERQELARGVAYKYAFITLAVSVFAYGSMDVWRWCEPLAGSTICVGVAMVVFAVTCIRKDAYLSLYEKPRRVMATFAVVAGVNLVIGWNYAHQGVLVEGGVLTFRAVNPICGVMCLVILLVYAARYHGRTRDESEDAE